MNDLSLYELLPVALEVLQLGKEASFVPDGRSMLPTIFGGKSEVVVVKPTFPLKKYDIALYTSPSGFLVLHRVIDVCNYNGKTEYILRGDNTYKNEVGVTNNQILAVVTRFKRKNRWQSVNARGYLFFVKLWCGIYPLRKATRFFALLVVRAVRKTKRTVFKK